MGIEEIFSDRVPARTLTDWLDEGPRRSLMSGRDGAPRERVLLVHGKETALAVDGLDLDMPRLGSFSSFLGAEPADRGRLRGCRRRAKQRLDEGVRRASASATRSTLNLVLGL